MNIRMFDEKDFFAVKDIYQQGINTGNATFQQTSKTWEEWDNSMLISCRLVATENNEILGWAGLSPVSSRAVYSGVAEVSVYVSDDFKGNHIGETLLRQLIEDSEKDEFWTLQAGIFSENKASINLHLKCGFRIVGVREKIGKLKGKWYDNHFLERRSDKIN